MDTSFAPAPVAPDVLFDVAFQGEKLIVSGNLSGPGTVRLLADGQLDATFAGAPAARALGVLPDSRIVLGGQLTGTAEFPRSYLAGLHPDGALDETFADGSLDSTFTAGGSGEGGNIGTIPRQPEGRLLIAGNFNAVNDVPRLRLARLCMDSSPDTRSPFALFSDATRRTNGLVGSYINYNLRSYAPQTDWRLTQTIAGQRVDATLRFISNGWGSRLEVGLAGGTDAEWENFSVQWDGYVEVFEAGTRFATRSDDGSRLWIDLNNDGVFAASGPEFINNHWGTGQGATVGDISQPVPAGLYRIRIQYEEGNGDNALSLVVNPPGPVSKPTVRVAYVVPSNRSPQSGAVFKLQRAMLMFQRWYREQMDRNGFGPKTFALETGENGVTPKVHVVLVPETDDYLRGDVWGRTIGAAAAVGVPVWTANHVWFIVPECHLEKADGSIDGGMCGGASWGSGSDPGVGMLGSDGLARFDFLTDDRPYAGLVIPALGQYPLVQDRSFPWFEGTTLSSTASSIMGAALHEFSHGFGLPHDMRNDQNFHGNLMGNGLRGIRGYFHPDRYPDDYTRLSYLCALALNTSRYFNAEATFTDETRPNVSVLTSGAAPLTNGQLRITFVASDGGGLGAATLDADGDLLDAMPLTGTSTNAAFLTPVFTPGQSNHFVVSVFDRQGNKQQAETYILPATGVNLAPRPFLKILPPTPVVGQTVTLSAENTSCPDDDPSLVRVEWDLDGDGQFDTAPTTTKTLTTNLVTVGVRLIRARLTDPDGATPLAIPLGLRVIVSDAVAPTLAVTAPADLGYTLTNTTLVSGTASDSSGVHWLTVNGQLAATVNAFANWSCPVGPLTVGTNEIAVVACDQAAPPNLHTNRHRIVYATGEFDGDGDGMPDAWEFACFGAVDAPEGAADADPDIDGLTNIEECLAGTDPRNAASVLCLEALAQSGAEVRLRFRTVAGRQYCIEGNSILGTDAWTVLATNVVGDGSVIEWTDHIAAGAGQRFYRIRLIR